MQHQHTSTAKPFRFLTLDDMFSWERRTSRLHFALMSLRLGLVGLVFFYGFLLFSPLFQAFGMSKEAAAAVSVNLSFALVLILRFNIMVQRMRDIGFSTALTIFLLLTFFLASLIGRADDLSILTRIVLVFFEIMLFILPGTPGANRYGASPEDPHNPEGYQLSLVQQKIATGAIVFLVSVAIYIGIFMPNINELHIERPDITTTLD